MECYKSVEIGSVIFLECYKGVEIGLVSRLL